jgi:hypothetical protein
MWDLAFWSLVIGLTPAVLSLTWELAAGIGSGLARVVSVAEHRRSLHAVSFCQPMGCISVPARIPGRNAARS